MTVEPDRLLKSDFGRQIDLDLSTPEHEFANLYFPCDQTLNWSDWLQGLIKHNPAQLGQFLLFQQAILAKFSGYQIPVIELDKTTSRKAVCLVFEKVNTGGDGQLSGVSSGRRQHVRVRHRLAAAGGSVASFMALRPDWRWGVTSFGAISRTLPDGADCRARWWAPEPSSMSIRHGGKAVTRSSSLARAPDSVHECSWRDR